MSRPQLWHQVWKAQSTTVSPGLAIFHTSVNRTRSLPFLPWHNRVVSVPTLGTNLSRAHNSKAHWSSFVSSPLNPQMFLRRSHYSKAGDDKPLANGNQGGLKNEDNNHDSEHHSHSHLLFGHSHSQEHNNGAHSHGAETIIAALEGAGDRGSRITLVGLFFNIALTAAKGIAGWYMHSASLLADAGHSLSDLLGDFVTLFCWRLSRKPPSERYPYGFAKFETIGTTTISILLVGGALGIGFHSYHLLITTLSETASTLHNGPLQELLQNVTSVAPSVPVIGHTHMHAVDPNAAWFAAVSVLTKEWLYRVTKLVADEEKSPVLLANAIHHRSDAYSSLVAFFAIVGTWLFPALPLDPIGGLLVSFVILRQGFSLLSDAWDDLTDAGVAPRTRRSLERILDPLLSSNSSIILGIQDLRARRAGSLMFVDLTANVSGSLSVHDTSALEEKIARTLKDAKKEITEVRVKFQPSDSGTA